MVAGVFDDLARKIRSRPPVRGAAVLPLLWLGVQFALEKERWRLWVPVLFAIGIGLYFGLKFEPPPWLGVLITVCCSVAARRFRDKGGLTILFLALAIGGAGFTAAQLQSFRVAAPVLNRQLGPTRVAGQVLQIDQLPQGRRLLIEPRYIGGLTRRTLPLRVRVHIRDTAQIIEIGDRVSLRAILMPPPPPSYPGGYDFQREAYFERLGGVGFALGKIFVRSDEADSWAGRIMALRRAMAARIEAALPGMEGTIAAAIVTGQRGAIPPDVNQDFRNSGLAHLLVIAGLHMSLVIGFAFAAFRGGLALIPSIALRYPIKKWAAFAALILAFSYLVISGAAIPTQRAFIMCALVLGATLTDRLHLSIYGIAVAALCALTADPEALNGVSFQMSFAAVVGLIGFYETFGKWMIGHGAAGSPARKAIGHLAGVAVTTLIATLATAPFSLFHFNQLALFSILANVVAVPVAAFWIMPWALASCLLMPLGLECVGLVPMGWGLSLVERIAHWTASLPYATLMLPPMPLWGLIAIALGGVWLCIWQRPWRLLGLAGVAAGFAGYFFVTPPDLLVAPDGKLFALRGSDGAYRLSSARSDKMTAEAWRRIGTNAARKPFPGADEEAGAASDISCASSQCDRVFDGYRVVLTPWKDLPDTCPDADLIVSREPVNAACRRNSTVIDGTDIARNGAYEIWLRHGLTVENANERRGNRPWVIHSPAASGDTASSGQ